MKKQILLLALIIATPYYSKASGGPSTENVVYTGIGLCVIMGGIYAYHQSYYSTPATLENVENNNNNNPSKNQDPIKEPLQGNEPNLSDLLSPNPDEKNKIIIENIKLNPVPAGDVEVVPNHLSPKPNAQHQPNVAIINAAIQSHQQKIVSACNHFLQLAKNSLNSKDVTKAVLKDQWN